MIPFTYVHVLMCSTWLNASSELRQDSIACKHPNNPCMKCLKSYIMITGNTKH